jgi:ABC-type lipoprotein release transport system permease subunit
MGVRLALGATARHLRRTVIGDALRPVVLGVVAGTIGAFWAGQFLQAFLVGVDARDPWTLGLVVAVLVATAVAAAWLPARRASLVNPATTLRAQ